MPRAKKVEGAKAPEAGNGAEALFGRPAFVSPERDLTPKPGVLMEALAPKTLPTDAGYVNPDQRMNPDYHDKAKESVLSETERMKKSMGYGTIAKVINPSPNSIPRVKHVFA
jgi:hypothetical protein